MIPRSSISPTNRSIKIKSPKSGIKLHKLRLNETFHSPPLERTLGANASNAAKLETTEKISQAWDRLKISALSKAIAMAPDVTCCTIGPDRAPLDEEEPDADLSNAVTSTPLKPRKRRDHSLEVSEIKEERVENPMTEEMNDLELVKQECLRRIEIQITRLAEKKKNEMKKLWLENDEKIKEKLAELKEELERERLFEIQQQMNQERADLQLKADQNKIDHDKKKAESDEKIRLAEQKRKDLEEKQKQKREELKQCITRIHELQMAYNKKYNHISEMTRSCKDKKKLNELVLGDLPKLKKMNESLLKLVAKCRERTVVQEDVTIAENLVLQINVIGENFFTFTERIRKNLEKAEEERKNEESKKELIRKQEEAQMMQMRNREKELKAKEEGEKLEKEKINKSERTAKLMAGVQDCISGECLRWHCQLSTYLEDYERDLSPLLLNDSMKNFRLECQKAVNVPVNAISPLDDIHLEDKLYRLSRLLKGMTVPLGDNLFLPTGHPLGVAFCTNLAAKKFVKQGELTVSSKPEAAFAIAAVIVALWVEFPDFGRLLLAHFHRKCPYLIPAFMPQVEGQSNEDYLRMLGYQYSKDGKVESQDKFLRRMSGVMRLYAAILVTPLKRSQVAAASKHPHSMREAWRWLTATLNLRARPDISPTLIFDFLEVTGHQFYHTYGSQFTKLLQVLCTDYFSVIEQITPDGCGGPVVRLKSFLEKMLKEGQVPPPNGYLPPNFW